MNLTWQPAAELDGGTDDCGSGLLLRLTRSMRAIAVGEVLLLRTQELSVLADLPAWARLAGHELLDVRATDAGSWQLWILRGERDTAVTFSAGKAVPLGRRLWLYTNFHCNLACTYCCAESSPHAAPRLLPVPVAAAAVEEFLARGGTELLLTGGEPFLHPDLGRIVEHAAARVPVVVLTNAMVFGRGNRLATLRAMDRDRVTLQVSLDSAGPQLHDRQRGAGSHARALAGIVAAKELGFRVRVAATVGIDELATAGRLHAALAQLGVAEEDRLLRPIAAEGFAVGGVHVSLDTVEPEPTLTADGAWWHPVAVTNPHLRVSDAPLPLATVFDVIADVLAVQAAGQAAGRTVFRCT